MSKKILYLRTDIYDGTLIAGGSVSHTLGVIKGFINLGHDVIYASSLTIPTVEELPLAEKVVLKNPRMLRWLRWKFNCLLSNVFFTYQALQVTRRHSISFIYQRYSLLNSTGVLVRWLTSLPLTLEYNGSEVWVNNNWAQKKKFKLNWIADKIELINLQRADRVIVVSQVLKDELMSRGIKPHKIVVNPNGVDTDVYDPVKLEPMRNSVRQELALENKVVFGFIGTFSQWHGIEVLARIIPAIVQQKPQAYFLLMGDGPLKLFLMEELKKHNIGTEHVLFLGMIPQHKACNYLAACDVYLTPTQPNPDGSRFFGSPTKLFEYMSMAKPIIASHIEQLADIIHPAIYEHHEHQSISEKVGFLVYPHDIDGFIATAIKIIETDADELRAMGMQARTKAIAQYTWTAHVQHILESQP